MGILMFSQKHHIKINHIFEVRYNLSLSAQIIFRLTKTNRFDRFVYNFQDLMKKKNGETTRNYHKFSNIFHEAATNPFFF